MCESKAVIYDNGNEKVLLDDVALMEFHGDAMVLYSIAGEKMELKNVSILKIDFINHKIYLVKR